MDEGHPDLDALADAQVAQLRALLLRMQPESAAEALGLLRTHHPEMPFAVRAAALTRFTPARRSA